MNKKEEISEKWAKASVIGTFWAASEIVLGSFLHNLNIPLSGNLLTSIGLVILISISYKWREKGLFWRAGLICALMKTLSPSAVIFGPMIAIFSQSVLLEIFVRVFGRTFVGYALGSMTAMSWNLFQKIINYIIFYGYNIIEIYKNLVAYAQKQLDISFNAIWHPLIILFTLYSVFGLISSIIGIKAGQKLLLYPSKKQLNPSFSNLKTIHSKNGFNYSLVWLITNIILMVSGLLIVSKGPWYIWSISIIAIISVWIIRYKRALRQLTKSKFWIYFFLITMTTAFVFTKIQSNSIETGILIGLQMNFRAAVIIFGFSVLGTELYNPKIRNLLLKSSFKQLPLALEMAFTSLPSTISSIPQFKTIIKNPVTVLHQIISQAELILENISQKDSFTQKVFILTGTIGQGKTTYLKNLIGYFRQKGITIGGIYSPRVVKNRETIGYDIIDINTDEREIFLRQDSNNHNMKIGRFNINLEGLQKGIKAIKGSNNLNTRIVVIDEVGILELQNQGWASNIEELVRNSQNHILLVIRDSFVEQVIEKWNLNNYQVFNISDNELTHVSDLIHNEITQY